MTFRTFIVELLFVLPLLNLRVQTHLIGQHIIEQAMISLQGMTDKSLPMNLMGTFFFNEIFSVMELLFKVLSYGNLCHVYVT